MKSIVPMSTAMTAAAARASALCENLGFDVYECVAPLGRVIVRMHRFSAKIKFKTKGVRQKEEDGGKTRYEINHLLSFPLLR